MESFIRKQQENGFQFLKEAYMRTKGDPQAMLQHADMAAIGARLQWSDDDLRGAVAWLKRKNLFEQVAADYYRITNEGHDEVEASETSPDGTDNFAGDVIRDVNMTYHISGPVGVVMTGSHNTATVSQALTQSNELQQHFAQLRQAAEALEGEARADAIELVDAIVDQSRSEKPKKALVKQYGEGLKGLMTPEMVPIITTVLTILGQHWT